MRSLRGDCPRPRCGWLRGPLARRAYIRAGGLASPCGRQTRVGSTQQHTARRAAHRPPCSTELMGPPRPRVPGRTQHATRSSAVAARPVVNFPHARTPESGARPTGVSPDRPPRSHRLCTAAPMWQRQLAGRQPAEALAAPRPAAVATSWTRRWPIHGPCASVPSAGETIRMPPPTVTAASRLTVDGPRQPPADRGRHGLSPSKRGRQAGEAVGP